ncbi:MAG: hypothetical protein HY272_11865 [Gammaproteobacteria bacterium]|nr:hypothetical protein [Gammaproteobacteria bacterium]
MIKRALYFLGMLLATVAIGACAAVPPQGKSALPMAHGKGKSEQPPWFSKGEPGVNLVANAEIAAVLAAGGEKLRVTGRASMSLAASETQIREGMVQVNGFSLALFNVPQKLLAGKIEVNKPSGVLGFAVNAREPQRLKYDPKSGRLMGELHGYIDADYMSALIVGPVQDDKLDLFQTATQPATLMLDIKLSEPLRTNMEQVQYMKAELDLKLRADIGKYRDYELPAFELTLARELPYLQLELAPWFYFEVAQRLCLQPVRIGKIKLLNNFPWGPIQFSFQLTGAGLAFGQPGANTQWAKDDVVFTYRDWKTIWKSGYWVVDTNGNLTSTEQSNLMAEVSDDDCIEVFFTDEFNPVSWGGGGATWGSGTAGSKIITSDANADGGVDFTHLAHELGHVMGLLHPNNAATANAVPASTGTLMCPSGYLNDNPTVNSQENENSLSNPLLTFAIKVKTAGPDCQNSADCGACP